MNRYRCSVLWLILLLLSALGGVAAGAPPITLKGLDGADHPLSEYIGRGKWVVLNVWGPACPPCVDEMPELQAYYDAHKDKDAIVVGVAIDYPSFGYAKVDQVRRFVDEYFISFPILLGDANIASQFGGGPLEGTPTTFVFTPDGDLVAMQLGAVTQKIIEDFIAGYRHE